MEQLVNFEIRNRLRRWTSNPAEAAEYRGFVLTKDINNAIIEQHIIIPACSMRRSEDNKSIYNYHAQYELVSFSKAYQAFVDARQNEITILCEWVLHKEHNCYFVQGRDYESFDIVLPVRLNHAEGSYFVSDDGAKFLIDPYLPYFANTLSIEELPQKLRPELI